MSSTQLKINLTEQEDSGSNRIDLLFSLGFRAFFLFSGVYAVLAMAAWLIWLAVHHNNAVVTTPSFSVAPHLWHGHEMLFGYAAGVLSGFLLTALPNWTNTPAVAGGPLIVLASTWLLGRFVVWFSATLPPLVVAIADLSHLAVLSCFVAHALSKKPAPRNLVFVAFLLMLVFANGAVHVEWIGWRDDTASWGLSLAIFLISTMIVVIGGRVVPAFTRNAIMRAGHTKNLPRSFGSLDLVSILLAVSVVLAHFISVSQYAIALAAAFAAAASAIRLVLWRGWMCFDQPIVWSLHLGYLMVVLGFAAVAFSGSGLLGPVAAQHVLAAGAVGCMTLAIMTRASLGHTGRPLQVNTPTTLAYVMVALSAGTRALAPAAFPESYFVTMYLAGGLWMAGFSLFCFTYIPILLGPSQTPGNTS